MISSNIKALREDRGMTQEEVAKLMGVQSAFVSALERGERNPGKKTMSRLCETFEVTEQEIRFGNRAERRDVPELDAVQMVVGEMVSLSITEQLEVLVMVRKWKEAHL